MCNIRIHFIQNKNWSLLQICSNKLSYSETIGKVFYKHTLVHHLGDP
jgi:hypothetical protein